MQTRSAVDAKVSPYDVILLQKNAKQSRKVKFTLEVSVKDMESGVENQQLMKTESTHRLAMKAKPQKQYKETDYNGVAAKYLSGNQFRISLVNMVTAMGKEFKP